MLELDVMLNFSEPLFVLEMQRGMHKKFVFPYRGKPVGKLSTRAWRDALARAGIKNFHWHDLRHTWASWLRQNGVPLDVVVTRAGAPNSADKILTAAKRTANVSDKEGKYLLKLETV